VREANLAHGAGQVRPPGVDGTVGERGVGGEVAEEVERQRRRPEQVGPQALVVEALMRLDERRPRPGRVERGRGDEGRTRLARVLEREAAADQPRRRAGTRRDRLGADRMTVGLAPASLVVPRRPAERRHRRPPLHLILGVPAVCGL